MDYSLFRKIRPTHAYACAAFLVICTGLLVADSTAPLQTFTPATTSPPLSPQTSRAWPVHKFSKSNIFNKSKNHTQKTDPLNFNQNDKNNSSVAMHTSHPVNPVQTLHEAVTSEGDLNQHTEENGLKEKNNSKKNSFNAPNAIWSDLNKDGFSDLVITESSGTYTWINNKNGGFTKSNFIADTMPKEIWFVTANSDEHEDLVMVVDKHILIFINTGNGSFYQTGQKIGPTDNCNVIFRDFDSDGDQDIAYSNESAIKTWINTGDGYYYDIGNKIYIHNLSKFNCGYFHGTQFLSWILYPNPKNENNNTLLITRPLLHQKSWGVISDNRIASRTSPKQDRIWNLDIDNKISIKRLNKGHWRTIWETPPLIAPLAIAVDSPLESESTIVAISDLNAVHIKGFPSNKNEKWTKIFQHNFNVWDTNEILLADFNNDNLPDSLCLYWLKGKLRGTTLWNQKTKKGAF